MGEFREVTKEEEAKMNALTDKLIWQRGEFIHWMTEIESELDELIVHNFINEKQKGKFFEILLWEDFRLSTKIRLFKEIPLEVKLKDIQSKIVSQLEYLSTIRNKLAHRLSMITPDRTFLIGKKHKAFEIDDKLFGEFKDRAISVLADLKFILLTQKGVNIDDVVKAKTVWLPISKIKGLPRTLNHAPNQSQRRGFHNSRPVHTRCRGELIHHPGHRGHSHTFSGDNIPLRDCDPGMRGVAYTGEV